jgi:hypothetical protein
VQFTKFGAGHVAHLTDTLDAADYELDTVLACRRDHAGIEFRRGERCVGVRRHLDRWGTHSSWPLRRVEGALERN